MNIHGGFLLVCTHTVANTATHACCCDASTADDSIPHMPSWTILHHLPRRGFTGLASEALAAMYSLASSRARGRTAANPAHYRNRGYSCPHSCPAVHGVELRRGGNRPHYRLRPLQTLVARA